MGGEYFRYEQDAVFGIIASPGASCCYDASGKYLLTLALEDVLVWNVRTASLTTRWHDPLNRASATCIRASMNGETYAVGYADGTIRLWSYLNNELLVTLNGHRSAVSSLVFDWEGLRLASGARDTDVILWDVEAELGLFRLRGHTNEVTALGFIAKGKFLVSAGKDSYLKLWDLTAHACIETLVEHRAPIYGMAIDEERGLLFTAGAESAIRIFTVTTEACGDQVPSMERIPAANLIKNVGTVERAVKERALDIKVLAGRVVVLGEKSIQVFRLRSEEETRKKVAKHAKKAGDDGMLKASHYITPLHLARTESRLYAFDIRATRTELCTVFCSKANEIKEYQVPLKAGEPQLVTLIDRAGHRGDIRAIAISSDEEIVATAAQDGLKLWNSSTGNCIRTVQADELLCAVFLAGDRHVLAGTRSGSIELFDVSAGTLLESVAAHDGPVWSISLHSDGKYLVSGSADKTVKFWDIKYRKKNGGAPSLHHEKTLQLSDDVLAVKLSPDGSLLAVALLDMTIKIFHTDSLAFYLSLYGHRLPVTSIDISTDGKILASAGADKNIKLWGLDFGDCRKSIFAHGETITALQFVPETHTLFSAAKDKLVKFWDADSGEQLLRLEGHQAEVSALSVARSGAIVVSAGRDHSVRVWRQSEEPLFPEEEREREMEEATEAALLNDNPHDEASAADRVGKKTSGALNAGEKIAEAIEAANQQSEANEEYELAKMRNISVSAPQKNPLILAYGRDLSPAEFVIRVLERIPTAELEEALFMIPLVLVPSFFKYLAISVDSDLNLALTTRVAALLVRLYHDQIVATPALKPVLKQVQEAHRQRIRAFRDCIGMNSALLKYIKDRLTEPTIRA